MRTSCIQCVSLLLFSLFLSHIQEKNTFVSSLLELPAGAKVIRSWYRVGAEKIYIIFSRHTKNNSTKLIFVHSDNIIRTKWPIT